MSIIFDYYGIKVSSAEEVRQQVRGVWQNAFRKPNQPDLDVSPSTPQGQIIDSQTAAVMAKDSEILYLANQLNPRTSQGIYQDALAQLYFINRQRATPTIVNCVCNGLAGTVIPKGAIIKTIDNITLIAVSAATISSTGVVNMDFQGETTGLIPVAANTATNIVTQVPGWDKVNNPTAGVTGRNAETRFEFDNRIKKSIAINSHGSAAALYGAIANVEGAIALVVLENTTPQQSVQWGVNIPPHSFFISVYGAADYYIAKTIYEKKDAGSGTSGGTDISYIDPLYPEAIYRFQICRPTPIAFGVKITLRQTPSMPANFEELIKTAITDNFNGANSSLNIPRVSMAETIVASRFYSSVIGVIGEQSLISVHIAMPMVDHGGSWVSDLRINADVIPVLDVADIIIEVI